MNSRLKCNFNGHSIGGVEISNEYSETWQHLKRTTLIVNKNNQRNKCCAVHVKKECGSFLPRQPRPWPSSLGAGWRQSASSRSTEIQVQIQHKYRYHHIIWFLIKKCVFGRAIAWAGTDEILKFNHFPRWPVNQLHNNQKIDELEDFASHWAWDYIFIFVSSASKCKRGLGSLELGDGRCMYWGRNCSINFIFYLEAIALSSNMTGQFFGNGFRYSISSIKLHRWHVNLLKCENVYLSKEENVLINSLPSSLPYLTLSHLRILHAV